MKRIWSFPAVIGLLALVFFASAALKDAPAAEAGPLDDFIALLTGRAGDQITDRYIVILRDNVDAESYTSNLEGRFQFLRERLFSRALKGFTGRFSAAVADRLRADPNVLIVEPDSIVTVAVQDVPTGIQRVQVPGIDNGGPNTNVDVAVIDTGIDIDHPDLNVVGGYARYSDYQQTCSFVWRGICYGSSQSLVCSAGTTNYDDGYWHGTHVAGTIGAYDNNSGVVGVAPGARLWSVRVLGASGNGCMSDVIAGVDWVTANASTIEVASMSLAGGNSPALCTAINSAVQAGVVVVVAAGNNNANASNYSPSNCSSAITVSAIADYNGQAGGGANSTCGNYGPDDSLASYSNYGSIVDIAAPGTCILSTYLGGGVATSSGTSMATPHVAGAIALDLATTPQPRNATGVNNALSRLLNNAFAQSSQCGFTGDRDSSAEPLLNLGAACSGGGAPVNNAPVASNDSFNTAHNTPISVSAPGVLGNDSDADPITAVLSSGPANAASFTLNANGSFSYTPTTGFSGSTTFTYRAYDSIAYSNTATVTINVAAAPVVNRAPTATNNSYNTGHNTTLNVSSPGVLGNDSDLDSNPLTAVLSSGPANAASFSLSSNGSFSYTPTTGFSGSTTFTYRAYDSAEYSNTATVTINVAAAPANRAPTASNNSYNTGYNNTLNVSSPGILGNDSDLDGNTITAVLSNGPSNASSFSLNANGSFSYTPSNGFSGSTSFTYRAFDGTAYSNTATVTITVANPPSGGGGGGGRGWGR